MSHKRFHSCKLGTWLWTCRAYQGSNDLRCYPSIMSWETIIEGKGYIFYKQVGVLVGFEWDAWQQMVFMVRWGGGGAEELKIITLTMYVL